MVKAYEELAETQWMKGGHRTDLGQQGKDEEKWIHRRGHEQRAIFDSPK